MQAIKNAVKNPDGQSYCIRRISGLICVLSGIIVIFTKVFYFIATQIAVPFDGLGQLLVTVGAGLLGLTSFDGILNRVPNNSQNSA